MLLLIVTLVGCSQSSANEQSTSGESVIFTNEEVNKYEEDNDIKRLALSSNADNETTTILGEKGIYHMLKDDSGEIVISEKKWEENKKVRLGISNNVIYVIINDKQLLKKGDMLKVTFDEGEYASEMFRSEREPYTTLFDYGKLSYGTVGDANLFIYDDHGNEIYEDSTQG